MRIKEISGRNSMKVNKDTQRFFEVYEKELRMRLKEAIVETLISRFSTVNIDDLIKLVNAIKK